MQRLLYNKGNKINSIGCYEERLFLLRYQLLCILLIIITIFSGPLCANPEGGQVVAGSAEITTPSANTVQINQASDKVVIDWRTYNIAPNEHTHYQQPSASSIALNRIDPTHGPSSILGRLSANGQVWLMNPAGIIFGASARVDVAGLLATTAMIKTDDFMTGNYRFIQSSDWNAGIVNEGEITVAEKGLVALVAPGVENNGLIQANLGQVVLGAGTSFTVDFYGDDFIQFGAGSSVMAVPMDPRTNQPMKNAVRNAGTVIANGGKVIMTANTASKIIDHAINMDGYVEAKTIAQRGGTIVLMGGDSGSVRVAGKINASGKHYAQKGGKVKILGKTVALVGNASIDVSGDGGGGTVLIGGNAHGLGIEQKADYTYLGPDVVMNASSLKNGDGGTVVVWSNRVTKFYGSIFAEGGVEGGRGGWVETSGRDYLDVDARALVSTASLHGTMGTWLLDPSDITISTGVDANYTDLSHILTPNSGVATSLINTTTLATALLSNNIEITTTNAGISGGGVGNINILNPISWVSANSLTLTAANNISIGAAITIGNSSSAQLILNASGSVTQTGIIGGPGVLVQQGPGTTILSQTNTYTGGTIINGGVLSTSSLPSAAGNSRIGTGALTINNGGILAYTGATATFNRAVTVGAGGGTIRSTTATATTLTLSGGISNSGALTFDTVGAGPASIATSTLGLSGSGSVIKSGAGSLIFGVANTYTGATTINSGTLRLTSANALGSGATQSSSTSVASGATLNMNFTTATLGNTNTITLDGAGVGGLGALIASTSTETLNNPITLAGNTTLGGANTMILNGVISDGGNNFGITKVGAGAITLGGANTYQGATIINAGTLTLTNANALGSGATQSSGTTVAATGAVLNLSFATATLGNTNTIILNGTGIATAGALTGSVSTGTLTNAIVLGSNTMLGGAANMTLNGVISDGGNGYSLTKVGAGTVTLAGVNTYSGGTTVTAGTLSITHQNALGTTGNLAINTAAILRFNLGGNVLQNASPLSMSGTGALTGVVGAGLTDALNNPITITGTTTITSTTATAGLILSGDITNSASNLTLTGSGNITVSGSLGGGAGGIIKTGTGTLTLANANTYTGSTAVNAGTLSVTNANGLGGVGGGVISVATASSLRLDLGGNALVNPNVLTLTGTATLVDLVAGGGVDTLNNPIVLTAAGTPTIASTNASGLLLLTNTITNNTAVLTIDGAGDTTVSGVIGAGSGGITKAGTGTLTLSALNTYTGVTRVNAGVLSVGVLADGGVASGMGAATNAAANWVLAGGGLQYTGGTTTINRNYTLLAATTGSISVTNAAANLTITGASTATTGALTKLGDGTLTFAGANLYTGLTTVVGGILAEGVNNALSSGPVTVNGGSFHVGAFSDTVGAVTLISGAITGSTGVLTGTSYAVQAGTVSAILAGSGGLTKTTSGTVTLSAANTYTGATTINNGVLSVSALANGGLASNIGASANAATNLVLGGGTLQYTGGTVSTNRNYTLTTGTTSTIDVAVGATNLTFLGASTATTGALTKVGSGVLTLSGANLYTGLTTVTAGTLAAGVNNALSSGGVTVAGGIYQIGSFSDTVGTVTLMAGQITGSTGILTGTSYAVENGSISAILGGAGSLSKTTSGTVTMSAANTFSGATVIQGGLLTLMNANSLGSSSSITVMSGGALELAFSSAALSNANLLTLSGTGTANSGALLLSGNNVTLNNPISLAGSSLISGSGSGLMTLNGAITGASVDLTLNFTSAGLALPAVTLTTSGNLAVSANGGITQSAAFSVPGTSDFNAGAHPISLMQNNNFAGAVSLLTSGAQNAAIKNSINLALGESSVGGALTAVSSGVITLVGSLVSGASGDSIVLSGAGFSNAGGFALTPGVNGRFLVWSSNPNPFGGVSPDNRGGLAYDFKQYNAVYNVSSVLGSGDGFLYTLAPIVTPSLTGSISKTYNATTLANLVGHYATSGAVDGDALSYNPTTGSYASANVGSGILVSVAGISIANATNGSAVVYGYGLASTSAQANIGTIDPATLKVSGVTANNKLYDGTTTATLNTASASLAGVMLSDVGHVGVNGGDGIFATSAVGNSISVTATSIPLLGSAASNYVLILPTGLTADILSTSPPQPAPQPNSAVDQGLPQLLFPSVQPVDIVVAGAGASIDFNEDAFMGEYPSLGQANACTSHGRDILICSR